MDNNSERDTHFLGFAKLLYEDFVQLARDDESKINEVLAPTYPENWRMKVERFIAQRGYDLVYHAFITASTVGLEHANLRVNIAETIEDVPDLTEWPRMASPEE